MLNEILAKESWDEKDINFLIVNLPSLPKSALVKLGLGQQEVPQETMFVEVKPKAKKGRKKIIK